MPPNSFLFVDATKTDRETRRRIRSHAMLGKNTGRTLNRPSRHKLAATENAQRQTATDQSINTQLAIIPQIPRIGYSAGNVLRTLQFPIDISDISLAVISKYTSYVTTKLYPPRLGLDCRPYWTGWLQMLFSDSATFHCGLALMEAFNKLFCGTGNVCMSLEGLHHINMALRLVNERLADTTAAVSDTTMGIIAMLIIQEQICQQGAVADIHFQGLLRIVELRGGFEQMEMDSKWLVLKICKLDISSAWQFGRPLHFYRNRLALVLQEVAALRLSPRYQETWPELPAQRQSGGDSGRPWDSLLHPELSGILLETLRVGTLLNAAPCIGHLMHVETYHEIVVSLGCRLVQADSAHIETRATATTRTEHIDRTVHTGLTIFTMILFLQIDRQRGINYPLVIQRLQRVLADTVDYEDSSCLCLRLWLLLLGAICLVGDVGDDDRVLLRILTQLHSTALQLNLQDWTQVCQSLTTHHLPWIESLHGDIGKQMWHRAWNK